VWVQTEERKIEHEILRDLHHELRVVRDELVALRREKESVHGRNALTSLTTGQTS
jgi:hypothetical protein